MKPLVHLVIGAAMVAAAGTASAYQIGLPLRELIGNPNVPAGVWVCFSENPGVTPGTPPTVHMPTVSTNPLGAGVQLPDRGTPPSVTTGNPDVSTDAPC